MAAVLIQSCVFAYTIKANVYITTSNVIMV